MRISALVFTLLVGSLAALGAAAQSAPERADNSDNASAGKQQPAPGQQMGYWFQKAANAYRRQDIEAWVEATEELHRLRPYNQDFMRHLVEGNARLGDLSAAFDMMLKMQQQGLSENWSEIDAVEPLREHNLYNHLETLMTEAGEPFGDVTTWSELGTQYPMPEALAVDGEGRVFVGTVRDGLILTSDNGEDWNRFASPEDIPELQSVFDLLVDAQRGHLWVATGSVSQFQGEPREDGVRSALLRLDLESGELQEEYPISSGSGRNLLGSLALAGDGTVFVADTQAPMIYRLDPGAEQLRPFFGHPNFTSLRGLALSEDDSLLYVADYELGIFVVDTTGGKQAWHLAVPETFNAGGIDGLFFWNDHLVAIQNAITPQRVVRLKLGADGLGVTAVAPLAAAREEFDTPTFGVMNGQDLYFLGASHWQHVDREGNPVDELSPVPIMTLDVDNASVQVVGQDILDQLKRQSREAQSSDEGEGDGEG
ncbi:hypothetical protein G4Y73_01960 [Wenzhouxiangella sp. XN201]|uniref:hypothetical protein n=1 Tax=Wenzhouxiangella sp. XN201 TaxID=2710755 RepID=UPI0013C881AE|nr:hypothetical protein [Wenzhouxiangella sp. XN201]NEZ02911.1 hypothetical protein [Wenzhouxiangella sp. XN201]